LAASDESAPELAPARRHEDDRDAIAACQGGEREAFDRLVEKYQRDVYRLCYRYVNNHQDANDMAQEVFLKAYRALDRFRGDSSFSTWLYRIAVNTCLNFRASRKPEAAELPEALADKKQRATLILKIYHDLTHEEVSAILGSTVGTVKANLFHALGNLRKMLVAEAGE